MRQNEKTDTYPSQDDESFKKTMLTNLKDIADEETINELLDTLNKLDAEINNLEKQLKKEGE